MTDRNWDGYDRPQGATGADARIADLESMLRQRETAERERERVLREQTNSLRTRITDIERELAEANAAVEQLAGDVRDVNADNVAQYHELERWRHGVPIEGDFVCPDSLAMTEAIRERDLAHQKLAALDADSNRVLEQRREVRDALARMTRDRDSYANSGFERQLDEARAENERMKPVYDAAMASHEVECTCERYRDHECGCQQLAADDVLTRKVCVTRGMQWAIDLDNAATAREARAALAAKESK